MLLLNSFMTLALGKDPSGKCTLCHLVLWVDAVRWILADWCDPWGPWCHQPIINIIKFCCCNWELLCVKFWSIIPYILCSNLSGVNYSSASNHLFVWWRITVPMAQLQFVCFGLQHFQQLHTFGWTQSNPAKQWYLHLRNKLSLISSNYSFKLAFVSGCH